MKKQLLMLIGVLTLALSSGSAYAQTFPMPKLPKLQKMPAASSYSPLKDFAIRRRMGIIPKGLAQPRAAMPAMGALAGAPGVPNVTGMPNGSLNWGIQMQQRLYAQGQQNAMRAFNDCITQSRALRARGIDPGNCGATPESASAAINRMNDAGQSYIRSAQHDANVTQQVNDNYDHRVIRDCTKVTDGTQTYWSCPNGNDNTLTGH